MKAAVVLTCLLAPTRLLAADDAAEITALTGAFYQAVSSGDRDALGNLAVGKQSLHCGTAVELGPVVPQHLHLDIKSDTAWVTLIERRIDGTRRATLIMQKIGGEWKIFAQL